MRFWIFFFIIIFILKNHVGNALEPIELNILAFYYDNDTEFYSTIVKEFNEYSEKNNKNIKVNIEVLTNDIGSSTEKFKSTLESAIKKKKNRYDIYVYENIYISLYASRLLNLNGYLSKDIIDMYDPKIISELCHYRGKLLGLPIFLLYSVFYSNRTLLKKYKKPIPKTWNEMIETGKFILSEERKENNTDLIGFNGLFTNDILGTRSTYEFIYSFRDSVDAKFPDVKSRSFIDALKMMKKIKEELSSDEIFQSDDNATLMLMVMRRSIFLKYWILNEPLINLIDYDITRLPGSKEGISTSVPSGFNIGIDKDIGDERIDAAITTLLFLSSKDIQKRYLKNRQLITAINSLYYDEEVCKKADCELFINMQPLSDPFFTIKDGGSYSTKYRNYVFDYLYGDSTPQQVQNKILDIERIHFISLDTTDSYLGLTITIMVITIASLMLLSLLFLFRENFNPFFSFLSTDFWMSTVFGCIFILCLSFTYFGEITYINCYLYSLIQSLGISLTLIPILYKLIVKFPEVNKISRWVKKHKYTFFLFFVILDNVWNALLLIKPYSIEKIMVEDGQNFTICKAKSTICKLIIILKWVYIAILFLILIILIFIEWNIKAINYDLTFIMSAFYIDILAFFIFIGLNYMNVRNLVLYYLIHLILNFIIAISNYIFIFGYRLILAFARKTNVRIQLINKINNSFIEKDGTELKSNVVDSVQTSCFSKNESFSESNNYNNYEYNNNNPSFINRSGENMSSSHKKSKETMSSSHAKSSVFTKIMDYHNNADAYHNSNEIIYE